MNPSYDYDLIVIGAGIGGMVCAVTANGLGKRVAVVEKNRVGGNCTNTTCVPSKALIRLGHLNHGLTHLSRLGLLAHDAEKLAGRNIMPHIRGIVGRAYEKDLPETFEAIGIRMISGKASFVDPHHIAVDGKIISAAKFIIATGTSPLIPDIPGLKTIDYLTNETLYALTDLPGSLIILGGGVDGLEYAAAFGRLGVETTVVEMATHLVPQADRELANQLLRALRADGIRLLTGAKAVNLENRSGKVVLTYQQAERPCEEIAADRVLVAVGRKPDLKELDLEKAGVKYNDRGILADRKLRTSAPDIYACGDIAGPFQLATTAETQAIVAATNAFLPVKRSVDYANNVYVIFTEPPLAWIGLTEEQAHERYGRKLAVYRFPYGTMRRAMIDGNEAGMAKILCDDRGRIVGAHILGEAAGEVIHELQLIRFFRKPLYKLQSLTHAYPTYAQAIVGRASQLAFLDRMRNNFFINLALRILPGFANRFDLARDRLAETHPIDAFPEFPGNIGPASTPAERMAQSAIAGSPDFTLEHRQAAADTAVVDIRGTLSAACEQAFSSVFEKATTQAKQILLNFSGLAHMDLEGAGLLLVNASRAARQQIALSACGLSAPLRDVFHLTGLETLIAIYDDEEDALCCRRFLEKSGLSAGSLPVDHLPTQAGWAKSVDRLSLSDIPQGTMNINVEGRRLSAPVNGFGRLWEKRYRLHLAETDLYPRQIIAIWRSEFADFWPKGNHLFTAGKAPVTPGTAALLNLNLPGGLVLATGLMIIYTDDTSFGFMTAEGHILSGWITFSSFRSPAGMVIQVHPVFRASDPLMELGLRLGAASQEDHFWQETLRNLARRLGTHGDVAQQNLLIDPHVQFNRLTNLRHNAAIRSSLYMPVYLLKKISSYKKNVPEKSK